MNRLLDGSAVPRSQDEPRDRPETQSIRSLAIASCFVLVSCTAIADEALTLFEELCRTKAGTHIYEKVENVKGIYDATSEHTCDICELALFSGLRFVEFRITNSSYKGYLANYVRGPGLYRLTLEEPHHPNCSAFYERFKVRIKRLGEGNLHSDFKGKCVASQKIQKITAKYLYNGNSKDNKFHKRIRVIHKKYSDIEEKYTYAERLHFTYIPEDYRISRGPFSRRKIIGSKQCPQPGEPRYQLPRLSDVFIPSKEKN